MTKTKRVHQLYNRVSCYRARALPPLFLLFSSTPPPLSPRRPFAIVRLPFSATPRDNERKLLLLMFRCKITPVEASHATLFYPFPPDSSLSDSPPAASSPLRLASFRPTAALRSRLSALGKRQQASTR